MMTGICFIFVTDSEEISLMWFCPLFVIYEDGIISLSPPAVTFWWNLCFCTVPDGSKVKRANKEPRRAKAPPQGPLGEATSPQCKVTLRPAGLTDGLHRCHQMYFSLLLRCASFHATEQDTGGKLVVSMSDVTYLLLGPAVRSQSIILLFSSCEKLCFLDLQFFALLKTMGERAISSVSDISRPLAVRNHSWQQSNACMHLGRWLPFGNSRCSEPSSSLPNDQLPDWMIEQPYVGQLIIKDGIN